MLRTFLVAITLSPTDSPDGIADEISEILTSEGLQVSSVKPWSSPSVGNASFPTPTVDGNFL